ncbi:hypothetical protein [Corynebacterium qintianiae]|uniref:hypothetical protein n=1 Tax=Corynebacterium qintianiae TaxID=2709392 RepID=UPI0013EDE4C4|nr:hypothetical protein [Corynebacterium qintianiae]
MEQITLPAHTALVAHDTLQPEAMREFFDHYYPLFGEFMESVGVTPQAARAYYLRPPAAVFDLAAGFVIADADLDMVEPLVGDIGDGLVSLRRFEEMEVLTERVSGPYDLLGEQWEKFAGDALAQGHTIEGLTFEEYVTMPGSGGDPVTQLFIALTRPR